MIVVYIYIVTTKAKTATKKGVCPGLAQVIKFHSLVWKVRGLGYPGTPKRVHPDR